jgi:hypothetical protein
MQMRSTVTRFLLCLSALIWVGSLIVRGQMGQFDAYKAAAELTQSYAAIHPRMAPCYMEMSRLLNCQAGSLVGGPVTCQPSNCGLGSSQLPGSGPLQAAGHAAGLITGGGSGRGAGSGFAAAILNHQQEIMQGVEMGFALVKGLRGLRRRHKAEREAQPVQRGDPRVERDARMMQAMAQMMARQQADLEQTARLVRATVQARYERAASIRARAQELRAAREGREAVPAVNGSASGDSGDQGASAPVTAATAETRDASAGGEAAGNGAEVPQSGSSPRSEHACPSGWSEDVFSITAYGNDDLWLYTGLLAHITNEANEASTIGRYLFLDYSMGRPTPLFFTLAGTPTYEMAPGARQRFAVAPASDGSLRIRVRFCKE